MEIKTVDQTIDALKITNGNNQDDLNKLRLVANDTLFVHSESLICIMILKQIIIDIIIDYRRMCANYQHPIENIILIFILGIFCGKDTIVKIYDYAKTHFHFLKPFFNKPILLPKFLKGREKDCMTDIEKDLYINGMNPQEQIQFYLPSYNTLRRGIININPDELIRIRNLFIIYIRDTNIEINGFNSLKKLYISYEMNFLNSLNCNFDNDNSGKKYSSTDGISFSIIENKQDPRFIANKMDVFTYNNYNLQSSSPYQQTIFYRNDKKIHLCAIDGKSIKATKSMLNNVQAKHIISLYEYETGNVLGEIEVPNKTNEITQDTKVLDKIDNLENYFVSLDAMGCQKGILENIDSRGGLYMVKVKSNQKRLRKSVEEKLDLFNDDGFAFVEVDEINRSRFENRKYYISDEVSSIKKLWPHVKSVGKIERTIEEGDKQTFEIDYYIMNFYSKELFTYASRSHWEIENNLHRNLDCTFKEDACRVRTGNGAFNLNILRKFWLSIINNGKSFLKEKYYSIKRLSDHFFARPFLLEKVLENTKISEEYSINDLLANRDPIFY